MYLKIYVTEEEHKWAKETPGKVRNLIQAAMLADGKTVSIEPNRTKKVVIPEPAEIKKEPGFCENGHYAGVGMKKCKLCGSKVR